MPYPNPTPEVLAIGRLNFLQDSYCIPSCWYQAIQKDGKTNLPAVMVLAEIFDPYLDKSRATEDLFFLNVTVARHAVIWKNYQGWAARLGLTVKQVSSAVQVLRSCQLLDDCKLTPQQAVALLSQKQPQQVALSGSNPDRYTCSWCKGTTYLLQQHHYPIPAKLGGAETVSICANCHYEFHFLVRSFAALTFTENFFNLCKASGLEVIDEHL